MQSSSFVIPLVFAIIAAVGAAAAPLPATSIQITANVAGKSLFEATDRAAASGAVDNTLIEIDPSPGGVDGRLSGVAEAQGVFGRVVTGSASASLTNESTRGDGAAAQALITYSFQISSNVDQFSPFYRAVVPTKISAIGQASGSYVGEGSQFGAFAEATIRGPGIDYEFEVVARGGSRTLPDIVEATDQAFDSRLPRVDRLYEVRKVAFCGASAEALVTDRQTRETRPGAAGCSAFIDPVIELDDLAYRTILTDLGRCGGPAQDPCPNVNDVFALEFSEPAVVPLPPSAAMLAGALGLAGLLGARRRSG